MRPEILFPLFAPVTTLEGIGPRYGKLFERLLGGGRTVDLCFHLPSSLIDRRYAPKVAEAEPGRIATLTLRIGAHRPPRTSRQPYRIEAHDDTGSLDIVFFHAQPSYLEKALPEGELRVISGRVEAFAARLQVTHPDHIGTIEDLKRLQTIEPVYGLTAGLANKVVTKAAKQVLARCPDLPEWIETAYLKRQEWPGWREALASSHQPQGESDLSPLSLSRQRLAFDELLSNQLALHLVRRRLRRKKGREIRGTGRIREQLLRALTFELTSGQRAALADIEGEMASANRMLRLLQGDVGSGKTVVALLSMAAALEAGGQAALMAPTEVLARQHLKTIEPLAKAAGIRVEILTGRERGRARDSFVERLRNGEIDIALGTHALFQEGIEFRDLMLAVIDEQHRFGVHQRLTLTEKGKAVDVLVLTATPIPRTLMLTAYGDMDVSRLTEKPAGRRPIDTRTIPLDRLAEVEDAVGRAISSGAKVYWICPLVEESEKSDLAAAEARAAELRGKFPGKVGLVHGRMASKDKSQALDQFAEGAISLLVATTVIEVGIDVREASIIVIEHAERFGLAQLHQLRGRVGRGDIRSTCILLYQKPLGETAKARLKIMRETDDGFRIAEEDLRLRGAGELLGTRQSGLPTFRLADLLVHDQLLAAARDDARLIVEQDPELTSTRGKALRILLYLFERDAAVKFLQSG